MKLLLCLLFCLGSRSLFAWDADPPAVPETYLLLDARSAADDDLAKIFTAAAQAYRRSDWAEFRTFPTTSLIDVLTTQYNLKPTDAIIYPKTYQAVWGFIRDVNHISEDRLPATISPALLTIHSESHCTSRPGAGSASGNFVFCYAT